MTVNELSKALGCKVLCMPDGEREVTGGYCGDLLSWVMGRAESGDAWVTIMSNINIIAVATLADPACIVLAEGVEIDADVLNKAEREGVNVISSTLDSFALCAKISELI